MILPLLLLLAPPTACEAHILDYRTWRAAPHQDWHFVGTGANKGALSIFGAEHLRDPAAAQFAAIDAAFGVAKPDLVLFEGPDRGTVDSAEAAIRTQGESGYARYLAARAGVTARSLEPDPAAQAAALKSRFADDRIVLFFVLREATRLRDREAKTGAELDRAVAVLLGRMAPLVARAGLTTTVNDVPSLAAAAHREWPDRDWHDLPSAWFAPGSGPAVARFLPAINTAVSDFRNVYLVRLGAVAVARGQRVFVVVGRNHVPIIAPALRCVLRG